MTRARDTRGGLRDLDRHASWREVYLANNVDPDHHETQQEVTDVTTGGVTVVTVTR